MNFKTKLYINGEWVLPKNCGTFKVMNPATGSLLTECSNATAEDVDKAVAAARKCLEGPSWGFASTGTQRATVLRKLGEIIAARKDEIANLDTLDMGKPIREALADVVGAIAACAHFAQLAERQDMQQFEKIANGTDDFNTNIVYEPVGVCSATSRVLVQSGVRKQLCEKLYTKLRLVRLGPSLPVESEEETKVHGGQKIGPVV
eukprot:gene8749-18097_t